MIQQSTKPAPRAKLIRFIETYAHSDARIKSLRVMPLDWFEDDQIRDMIDMMLRDWASTRRMNRRNRARRAAIAAE